MIIPEIEESAFPLRDSERAMANLAIRKKLLAMMDTAWDKHWHKLDNALQVAKTLFVYRR